MVRSDLHQHLYRMQRIYHVPQVKQNCYAASMAMVLRTEPIQGCSYSAPQQLRWPFHQEVGKDGKLSNKDNAIAFLVYEKTYAQAIKACEGIRTEVN